MPPLLRVPEPPARLAEIRTERNRLTTEIANLDARAFDAPDERRAGYEERRERLNTAIERLDQEDGELRAEYDETRREQIRDAARDGTATESGDGAAGRDPYRDGDEPRRGARQLDGALRAIERHSEAMRDPGAIERALRADQTGLGAQYLEAVADEHYRSAFELYLAHGDGFVARMTPREHE